MKYILLFLLLFISFKPSSAQTNTFPENGNIGIGTMSPSTTLHINGITSIRSSIPTDGFLSINPGGPTTQGYINWWKPGSSRIAYLGYNDGVGYDNLGLTLEGGNFIINGGNVAIGTNDTRGYKFAVNGNIRAKEIKIEVNNWPDYVYTKSYPLPSLQETEKHIKEKGHLPGIPSAEEVKANGIDLGEMNAKLLQKIEELTLHLIEMEKKNTIQQKVNDDQNKVLRAEINALKSNIKHL
ncbi:hypothetical protein FBD94_23090 [Pedobacter hiemivivus]|uniref:BZIP transcription factor n=1 Tax=Pedobacter hiemivivus TaxID=2530454 RepID=A0A4U1FZP7_9SPHI|nr:hypothetical protein [Pedobacter hiemivivus]TKC56601.1 hypothetical protein FBD94_23090 [Pedobacter hiemivivus]